MKNRTYKKPLQPYQVTERMFSDEEINLAQDLCEIYMTNGRNWNTISASARSKFLRMGRYALQYKKLIESMKQLDPYLEVKAKLEDIYARW